jgi:hypothetical protein
MAHHSRRDAVDSIRRPVGLTGREIVEHETFGLGLEIAAILELCITPRQFPDFPAGAHITDRHLVGRAGYKVSIDSERGREMIARRFATVEPVFGNLRGNKKLTRFTLRSRVKVDGQWKLYCLVHNIEKLVHHGYSK